MNKNGFTLTELLAVVVIIGLISGIAGFSYTKIMNDQKIKECEQKIEFIEKQAIKYANDYPIMHRGNKTLNYSKEKWSTYGTGSTDEDTFVKEYLTCDTSTQKDDCDYFNPAKGDYFKGYIELKRNDELITAKYVAEESDGNDCE